MTRDGIYKSDLSPDAMHGIQAFLNHVDGGVSERVNACLPEQWAWIYFQLRGAEDRTEWFPKGKWATIQRIGQLLDECVLEHK